MQEGRPLFWFTLAPMLAPAVWRNISWPDNAQHELT